jgi:hypothetical protein
VTKEEMEYNEPIYSQRDLDEKLSAARDREKAAIAAALRQAAKLVPYGCTQPAIGIFQKLRADILALDGASTSTEKSQGAPGSLREGDART